MKRVLIVCALAGFVTGLWTSREQGIATAAGLVLAVGAALLAKRQRAGWTAGVRLVGALAITVALILAVDGVKTV